MSECFLGKWIYLCICFSAYEEKCQSWKQMDAVEYQAEDNGGLKDE